MDIRKVLLVDDEPDIRRVGQMSLELLGHFEVAVAGSGAEALAVAERARPDVILLDVMMPDLDGPATLQLLRARPELVAIPVIFVTAKVQRFEVDRYLAMGAAGVIRKPFDPATLGDDIRRIAGGAGGTARPT